MASLQFILHPLSGTDDQLQERFKEVADKLNNYGSVTTQAIEKINVPVKELVFGPNHIGLLLDDGRAFRVSYSINHERLDLGKTEQTKSGHTNSVHPSSKNSIGTSSRQLPRSRSRVVRSTGRTGNSPQTAASRSSGVIIGGTTSGRPLVAVPAPFVPEELISQAEVVLQGKSRNLIIRELQRTNLDVNLAVNNLLSRDDEEVDETEESSDNYVPEDLISLLDNGFHADNSSVIIDPAEGLFSEEIFSNYSSIRNLLFSRIRSERQQNSAVTSDIAGTASRSSGTPTIPGTSSGLTGMAGERDAFSRWRDRQYYGPRRWLANREDSNWDKETECKKKEAIHGSPLWISDELQPWPERNSAVRFSKIAAMYSEFIGLSVTGELHQWNWNDADSYKSETSDVYHPKTIALNLSDKIVHLSATSIRCTVATQSNKVASWMDEQLGYIGMKLEQPALSYPEFSFDSIRSLHTCALYSVVRTESDAIYWWGVLPFELRRNFWEKYRTKTRKSTKLFNTEITVGSQVIMKKCPIYQVGSIGFTINNGVPKVGQLLNSAWDFGDVCRFKILDLSSAIYERNDGNSSETKDTNQQYNVTASKPASSSTNKKESADRLDMPPPPSPASSTCSDAGSVTSQKRTKRVSPRDDSDAQKDEELWIIKDVVFVDDRSGPVGRVLKVDGDFVAVKFPNASAENKQEDDWQHCRLLKKDDVQVIKSLTSSKGHDFFQKTPKRINVCIGSDLSAFELLAITVDEKGIHSIVKIGSNIHYCLYNLHNGKKEQDSVFSTDYSTFIGNSVKNISLSCTSDSNGNSIILLRDGNRTIYPLTKDCVKLIKDPQWVNLPPVKSVAMSTLSFGSSEHLNPKCKIAIIGFAVETQCLMPFILRCDLKSVIGALNKLEVDQTNLTAILNEKCDGGRNIFHACVTMCSPTSNKEGDEKITLSNLTSKATSVTSSNLDVSSLIPPNTREGRSSNLRNMMNRLANVEADSNVNIPSDSNDESNPTPVSCWPPDLDMNSDEENLSMNSAKVKPVLVSDPVQRREYALLILQQMCLNKALQPHLYQLLCVKDSHGQTPFMLAVSSRAYDAGLILFNFIMLIAENDSLMKEMMIFPPGSSADQSPLYVLCYNDTCSFTWTGADHINQNIYECKTCGLTGSLCCCTECARVCHQGHDCKLKRTSPTAYCDCWEKCKCKALIAGNQSKRYALLCKIITNTDLVSKFNSRGEPILLFLIQTVGRQTVEQRQYRATSRNRNTSGGSRKTPSLEVETDMPDHDLEPPRFARKALERLLADWFAVHSMIMNGAEETPISNNESSYSHSQHGSTLLDKFTHNLFVKCNLEHLDILLTTIIKELRNTSDMDIHREAEKIARRFVRSASRLFVIFNLEKNPSPEKRRSNFTGNKHIQGCLRVFQALHKIAIEELCEVADALITPVRMGVVRPTAPFAMSSSNVDNCDDIFCVEPLISPTSDSPINMNSSEAVDDQARFNMRVNSNTLQPDENIELDAVGSGEVESSEQNEVVNREISAVDQAVNADEEASDNLRSDEAGQEEESDNDFNFNDAETESDSDDNRSAQDTQGNTQSRPTINEDTGTSEIFPYQDESGESSPPDDDVSEDAETDEHSDDGYNFEDEQLERRTSVNNRNNSAPQSLQWAVRARDSSRSSVRLPTGSGLVFVDPIALRRSNVPTTTVPTSTQEPQTMATTSSTLARGFGIVLRQISDLLSNIFEALNQNTQTKLFVSYDDATKLQMLVESRLKPTWDWMFAVMDATEAQLKFGSHLTNHATPNNPLQSLNKSSSSSNSAAISSNNVGSSYSQVSRREFFTYCLSLMRAQTSEHRDSLPVLDITALRHIAYVLDGIIYYMRNETGDYETKPVNVWRIDGSEDAEEELKSAPGDNTSGAEENTFDIECESRQQFFQRSDSTLSLGCLPPDPFTVPLEVALPLADKPHLLQPNVKREELFLGMPVALSKHHNALLSDNLNVSPSNLGLSYNYNKITNSKIHTDYETKLNVPEDIQEKSGGTSAGNEPSRNLYIQLKKKNYVDPNQIDVKPKAKRKDVPNKIECTTQMEVDNYSSDSNEDEDHDPISKNKLDPDFRPDVIVTPKIDAVNEIGQKENNSPPKGVIVRAGPSTVCTSSTSRDTTMDILSGPKKKSNSKMINLPARGFLFRRSLTAQLPSWNLLLGRWKSSLDLFGRVFLEDVGLENGSILSELRGFPVKETRFRRHMEKLRNGQQRDLTLSKLDRSRDCLLIQTFKELNTQFNNQSRRVYPPLTFNRVKVTFKDEPGEGSGVARSFYTSIAEALLANENLPRLEGAQVESSTKYGISFSSILRNKNSSGRDLSSIPRRGPGNKLLWRANKDKKIQTCDTRAFTTNNVGSTSSQGKKVVPVVLLEQCQLEDNFPLFYSPGKRGFYTPRQCYASVERINAFRNIGRLIGLCLLQNELLPLFLQRHVLKFILGRSIRFHDLAFFDPTVYESLRQLIQDSQSAEGPILLSKLELYFAIDLCKEEGGENVELCPGGRDIQVNPTNIYDYIQRYAEYRMIKTQEKALEAMKIGVFDVLPEGSLESLTAEDLRLLLNGVGDINISTLISYTTFNDESSEGSEKLQKFKRWFWSTIEKMSTIERQDLVYFWTASPALPASEEGFQPLPSVTIRPADDSHLPTANTCISRLYIPLYSSKTILRNKLLLAIKSKIFGFV